MGQMTIPTCSMNTSNKARKPTIQRHCQDKVDKSALLGSLQNNPKFLLHFIDILLKLPASKPWMRLKNKKFKSTIETIRETWVGTEAIIRQLQNNSSGRWGDQRDKVLLLDSKKLIDTPGTREGPWCWWQMTYGWFFPATTLLCCMMCFEFWILVFISRP